MLARPLLTALLAGLVSATGFAPLDWWPVLLLCLAVLLWLVHEAPTLKSALLRGYAFGVGHFTAGSNWLQHAFEYQDKMPPALGYFAVVLVGLYLAIYPAMAMGLAWRFDRAVKSRGGWLGEDVSYPLAAAAAWIATEWLRSQMFTGYPWNPLAAAALPTPLALTAPLIGTYALSGLVLVAAGGVLLLMLRNFAAGAAIGGGLLAAVVAGLLFMPFEGTPALGQPLPPTVRIVQPNIGQEDVLGDYEAYSERMLAKLIQLTGRPAPGAPPRLVLWPEGMVNQYVEDGYPSRFYYMGDPRMIRARIAATLGPGDQALIGGNALMFSPDGRVSGAANTVWSIDASGMLGQRYDKAHLVPFGEYLPLRSILAPLGVARFVMGDVDFIRGPGPGALPVPGFGQAGVQICYEIVFSGETVDPAARPDFLFNPSNDAWFGSWGPPQHLAQARLRAIEEGLPVLRATPTGISAVIDADGTIVASIPHRQEGAIEVPLPRPAAPTLFSRLGNWLALLAAAGLLLMAIANRRFAR